MNLFLRSHGPKGRPGRRSPRPSACAANVAWPKYTANPNSPISPVRGLGQVLGARSVARLVRDSYDAAESRVAFAASVARGPPARPSRAALPGRSRGQESTRSPRSRRRRRAGRPPSGRGERAARVPTDADAARRERPSGRQRPVGRRDPCTRRGDAGQRAGPDGRAHRPLLARRGVGSAGHTLRTSGHRADRRRSRRRRLRSPALLRAETGRAPPPRRRPHERLLALGRRQRRRGRQRRRRGRR